MNAMVKEHTRLTPKELINKRLLQEVKMELCHSRKTIAEIAHGLHFSEPNNLTRVFRNMEGITLRRTKRNTLLPPQLFMLIAMKQEVFHLITVLK